VQRLINPIQARNKIITKKPSQNLTLLWNHQFLLTMTIPQQSRGGDRRARSVCSTASRQATASFSLSNHM